MKKEFEEIINRYVRENQDKKMGEDELCKVLTSIGKEFYYLGVDNCIDGIKDFSSELMVEIEEDRKAED